MTPCQFVKSEHIMLHRSERGASLIMVMMILIVVSILGVAGVQISLMGERSARNDRDLQVATQAAEAMLMDAELELYIRSPAIPGVDRKAVFGPPLDLSAFVTGCGTSGNSRGLCNLASSGIPVWASVDFTNVTANAPTAAFGTFTNRVFDAGNVGVQPFQAPRYIIEPIVDQVSMDAGKPPTYAYRVTAMGFGPRQDTQVVMQMIFRN